MMLKYIMAVDSWNRPLRDEQPVRLQADQILLRSSLLLRVIMTVGCSTRALGFTYFLWACLIPSLFTYNIYMALVASIQYNNTISESTRIPHHQESRRGRDLRCRHDLERGDVGRSIGNGEAGRQHREARRQDVQLLTCSLGQEIRPCVPTYAPLPSLPCFKYKFISLL